MFRMKGNGKVPIPFALSLVSQHMQRKAEMNEKITAKTPIRHLRRSAVEEITGLSRSTIYALMSKGKFPRAIRLTGKAVAWSEADIADWLSKRPTAR